MARIIVLSAQQRSQVRGVSDETIMASLEPVALTDGRYILGEEVLDDPAHVEHRALLEGLPRLTDEQARELLPKPAMPGMP